MKIPLSVPDIADAEIESVSAVLRSGRLSLGPRLEEFEQSIAHYCRVPYAAGVSSGTAGLHLSIRALGIGDGDEVILPSFTFVAAANALRYERAIPVFVDIDPVTLNLDPAAVEAAITPKTRAILAVHTFGVPADMARLMEIAHRHGLLLIEDACEAVGAEFQRKKVGTFGNAGVFAFYPNKQITTAEGGAVVTSDPALAAKIKALRNHGRAADAGWLQHAELGYNYRLSELHCALGIEQLKRVDAILQRREQIARAYQRQLAQLPMLELPPRDLADRKISWFVYVVRVKEARGSIRRHSARDDLVHKLAQRGIETARYFAPIHLQPAYQGLFTPRQKLDITESAGARTLALPFFNRITGDQLDAVCSALSEFLSAGA